MLLAFLSFLAAFLLVLSAGLLLFYRETMLERLAHVTARPSTTASWLTRLLSRKASDMQTLVDPFQRILPRSPQEVSVLQKRLIRAGLREDYYLNLFYGTKVITPLFLTGLAFATGVYQIGPVFVFFVTVGLGFMLPDFLLGNRIKSRQLAIRLGLPDALDLLIICLEAGLGIDQALARVCDEIRTSQPELADEFSLVALEQRAGHTRADAWRNLSERTGLDTIRALASILIQADQFGTSMARSLRVHSESLRTKRRQAAEEQAAKTTVKLVFPLVFFIFPSMFVVVIAPSAIVLAEAFDKYLLN
jgi:tight adherence protein C